MYFYKYLFQTIYFSLAVKNLFYNFENHIHLAVKMKNVYVKIIVVLLLLEISINYWYVS